MSHALYPSYGTGNNFPSVECHQCGRTIEGGEDCWYDDYELYFCQDCEEKGIEYV